MMYNSREATIVCKVFMCALVLASLDPLTLCPILFTCLHSEKTSRMNVVRDTEKGISMNTVKAKDYEYKQKISGKLCRIT